MGELSWMLFQGHRGRGFATRAVRMLADYALSEAGQGGLGYWRVEAKVEPDNQASLRVATRSGLRREGLRRVEQGHGDRDETASYVVLARLVSDPPLSEPEASGRCSTPSSPASARSVSCWSATPTAGCCCASSPTSTTGTSLAASSRSASRRSSRSAARSRRSSPSPSSRGGLLLTDWLPPWGGWDDAVCLVFDGGVHHPSILDEIVTAGPRDPDARSSALSTRSTSAARTSPPGGSRPRWPPSQSGGPAYTESGRVSAVAGFERSSPGPTSLETTCPRVVDWLMVTYVYDFAQGNKDQKDLLGGKGANLAEMTNLGLPVPPGLHHHHRGLPRLPSRGRRARRPRRRDQRAPRRRSRRRWAAASATPGDPLLVWVRSGAKFSMPGMMETVLNVGLNDESVQGLAASSDNERFAYDSYRRLLQMFGTTVLGIEAELFPDALDDAQEGARHDRRHRPRRRRPRAARRDLQGDHREAHRPRLPAGPARAARPRRARRLRLLEHRARACSTAARSRSPRTSAPPSTCRPWSSATGHGLRLRRLLHPRPGQRRPGGLRRLPPERPGRGRRRGHPQHRVARRPRARSTRPRTTSCSGSCPSSSSTTRTCATSSSPSSAASSGCCRPASASGPPRRRSGSRCTWPTRASSTSTRRCAGSTASSWPS